MESHLCSLLPLELWGEDAFCFYSFARRAQLPKSCLKVSWAGFQRGVKAAHWQYCCKPAGTNWHLSCCKICFWGLSIRPDPGLWAHEWGLPRAPLLGRFLNASVANTWPKNPIWLCRNDWPFVQGPGGSFLWSRHWSPDWNLPLRESFSALSFTETYNGDTVLL